MFTEIVRLQSLTRLFCVSIKLHLLQAIIYFIYYKEARDASDEHFLIKYFCLMNAGRLILVFLCEFVRFFYQKK